MMGADQADLNTARNLFVLSVLCRVTEVDFLRRWEAGDQVHGSSSAAARACSAGLTMLAASVRASGRFA